MRTIIARLEWLFRHAVVYPLFRLVFHNPQSDHTLDLKSIDKLLILRYDRIGDMIVTTPILRALKARHPSLRIGIVTSPANAEIIAHDPHVDEIYVLHTNWLRLLKEVLRARRMRYDVVLNFIFNRTTSGGILANLIAPKGLKVGQGAEKYRFYFNRLLTLDRSSQHMVEVLASYVQQVFGFQISREELRLSIAIDTSSTESVRNFLDRRSISPHGFIVVNISATDEVRKISQEQVHSIVEHLCTHHSTFRVVIISAPHDRRTAERVARLFREERVEVFPEHRTARLLEIAALLKLARCVITPDTSIIHFASAVQTPVLGLFSPLQITHEWLPYNVKHLALRADDGQPVEAIPAEKIRSSIDTFLKEVSHD
jgi:ADP-heptose:LPS heptosyltransferase